MIVGHDQGFSISANRGRTWYRNRLPNAQMYHVTVDSAIPYNVVGNKQDGPSYRGPSNSRIFGGGGGGSSNVIPRSAWHTVAGGESGWSTPDPTDPPDSPPVDDGPKFCACAAGRGNPTSGLFLLVAAVAIFSRRRSLAGSDPRG